MRSRPRPKSLSLELCQSLTLSLPGGLRRLWDLEAGGDWGPREGRRAQGGRRLAGKEQQLRRPTVRFSRTPALTHAAFWTFPLVSTQAPRGREEVAKGEKLHVGDLIPGCTAQICQ